MGWNIGGSQGQYDAGGYHTSPNKAVYLGAHPKCLLMNTCGMEN